MTRYNANQQLTAALHGNYSRKTQGKSLSTAAVQASDVTAVVAIHGQVAVLQKAHAMLADHLELDSWAEIWAAADGQQAFDAASSRVAHAMTAHIIGDLLPNFAYCEPTHRFTRMVSAVVQHHVAVLRRLFKIERRVCYAVLWLSCPV